MPDVTALELAAEAVEARLTAAGRILRAERSTALERAQAAVAWGLLDALPAGSMMRKVIEARCLGLTTEAIAARTGIAAEDVADIFAVGIALIDAAGAER